MTGINLDENNSIPIPLSNSSAPQASSRIVNMAYADHVTELKYLKNQDPGRFKLDNDMSMKKLPPLV